MLIISDRELILREVRMILDRENIDLEEYRREHAIPDDYRIDIVHTDGDYAFTAEENGMTVTRVEQNTPDPEELKAVMKEAMKRTSQDFYMKFCYYCDKYGRNEVEVYQAAGLDRRVFSKLKKPDYRTSKDNVVALGLSLGLRRHELDDLMRSAGYTFDRSDARDIAIEHYLLNGGKRLENLDDLLSDLGLQTVARYR